MTRASGPMRAVAILAALSLSVFSLGFTWSVVADYADAQTLPRGAVISGVPVGGLTRQQALVRVHDRVEAPLLATVKFRAGTKTVTFDPATMASVDVTGMVDAAFTPQQRLPFVQRVYRRIVDRPLKVAVERRMTVDRKAMAAWVRTTARKVDVAPRNATLDLAGSGIRIGASRQGQQLDTSAAVLAVQQALDGTPVTRLPVRALKPKITERAFARVIVVRLSSRRLTLFRDGRREKAYSIAVGQPAYPTPTGRFQIVRKEKWPTWTNPGSGWASSMPAVIPPGPGNPLGTRAMAIDAPGVLIHGTSNDGSIGTAASHACMRMHMWDVEDLFPRMQVGDRVIIVP